MAVTDLMELPYDIGFARWALLISSSRTDRALSATPAVERAFLWSL